MGIQVQPDTGRTSDGLFNNADVKRLALDAEFQKRFGNDPEINRLWKIEPDANLRMDEDAQALGGCQRIAGVDVPPVTMGHFRLLTAAGNAFAELHPDLSSGFSYQLEQFTEALFILHFGSKVVANFADVFRWKKIVAATRKQAGDNAAMLGAVLDAERRLAEALRPWDMAVLQFAAKHVKLAPGETIEDAAATLALWLSSAFSGLSLYPQINGPATPAEPDGTQKKKGYCGTLNLRRRLSSGLVRFARHLHPTKCDGRSR
jgi:hypothetical protein